MRYLYLILILTNLSCNNSENNDFIKLAYQNDSLQLNKNISKIKKVKPQTIFLNELRFGMNRSEVQKILLSKLESKDIVALANKGFYFQVKNSQIADSLSLGQFDLCYYAMPIFYDEKLSQVYVRQYLSFDYNTVYNYLSLSSAKYDFTNLTKIYEKLFDQTKKILNSKYQTYDSIHFNALLYETPFNLTYIFAPDFYIEADNSSAKINLKSLKEIIENYNSNEFMPNKIRLCDEFKNQSFYFDDTSQDFLYFGDFLYKCPYINESLDKKYLFNERVLRIQDSINNIIKNTDSQENQINKRKLELDIKEKKKL